MAKNIEVGGRQPRKKPGRTEKNGLKIWEGVWIFKCLFLSALASATGRGFLSRQNVKLGLASVHADCDDRSQYSVISILLS